MFISAKGSSSNLITRRVSWQIPTEKIVYAVLSSFLLWAVASSQVVPAHLVSPPLSLRRIGVYTARDVLDCKVIPSF